MLKLWFTTPLKKGEHYLSFVDEFVLDSLRIVSFYTFVFLLPICLLILRGNLLVLLFIE